MKTGLSKNTGLALSCLASLAVGQTNPSSSAVKPHLELSQAVQQYLDSRHESKLTEHELLALSRKPKVAIVLGLLDSDVGFHALLESDRKQLLQAVMRDPDVYASRKNQVTIRKDSFDALNDKDYRELGRNLSNHGIYIQWYEGVPPDPSMAYFVVFTCGSAGCILTYLVLASLIRKLRGEESEQTESNDLKK